MELWQGQGQGSRGSAQLPARLALRRRQKSPIQARACLPASRRAGTCIAKQRLETEAGGIAAAKFLACQGRVSECCPTVMAVHQCDSTRGSGLPAGLPAALLLTHPIDLSFQVSRHPLEADCVLSPGHTHRAPGGADIGCAQGGVGGVGWGSSLGMVALGH